MKDLGTLKKEYKAKIESAQAKANEAGGQSLTKEQAAEINAMFAEADELKVQIDLADRLAKGQEYLNEPKGTSAAQLHGFRQSGPDEGDTPVDSKSWRSFSIKVPNHFGELEEKQVRFHVPLAVQKKGYESAYESYLRNGKSNMGPSDLKTLSEATEAGGAVLIPEDMQTSILKKVATATVVRQFARVITASRDIVKWPRIKWTGDNKYTSGVRITWTGEQPTPNTVHRVTDQIFGEHLVPVYTAMASQLQSADLLEDAAFDVMGISADLFGEAYALGEELVFWSGNGAAQPRGILTDLPVSDYGATIVTAAAANTIDANDLIDVAYSLPTQYEFGARWFFTKATEKVIRKLQDTDGGYLWPIVSNVGQLGAVPRELLDYPTSRTEFIDDISNASNTTTYPAVLGNLNAYLVVDRVGLSIKRDENLYSEYNQVLLLGRKRVGGQLIEGYRLAALKTVNST